MAPARPLTPPLAAGSYAAMVSNGWRSDLFSEALARVLFARTHKFGIDRITSPHIVKSVLLLLRFVPIFPPLPPSIHVPINSGAYLSRYCITIFFFWFFVNYHTFLSRPNRRAKFSVLFFVFLSFFPFFF